MRSLKNNDDLKNTTVGERAISAGLTFSFENHWKILRGHAKDGYNPALCQELVDFCLSALQAQFEDKDVKVPPPHLSAFARLHGTTVRRMSEWGELFPEFAAAMEIAKDVHCEMLINGSLLGSYHPKMGAMLLAHYHHIYEKKEDTPNPIGALLIPMSAAQAINFLIAQQGIKPPKLPDAEDADFDEVGKASKP